MKPASATILRTFVTLLITLIALSPIPTPATHAQGDVPLPLPRQFGTRAFEQQQKLIPSDGRPGYNFGYSALDLSQDGDMIMVSDVLQDDTPPFDSKVYVYLKEGHSWKENQRIERPEADDTYMGRTVNISGDGQYALIGGYDTLGGSGVVYAYKRDVDDQWIQIDKLTPPGPNRFFARSVGISDDGTRAVIGASSTAYVFIRSGDDWTLQFTLNPPIGGINNYARSITMSGDGNTILVGSENGAFVFVWNGSDWVYQTELDDALSRIGWFVSLSTDGDTALISAVDGVGAAPQPFAIVFVRSDTDVWTQQQKLVGDEYPGNNGLVLVSVDLAADGQTAVVGDWQADNGAELDSGAAYVFSRNGNLWTPAQRLTVLDGVIGDFFGIQVGIAGDTVVSSAFGDDNELGNEVGSVYVFQDVGDITRPPNDAYDAPITFSDNKQFNFSEKFELATKSFSGEPSDPIPDDPNCDVDLPQDAGGIHYEIEGSSGLIGDVVVRAGAPAWYRRAPMGAIADTAIVVYKVDENDTIIGSPVACDDDEFIGTASVSNVTFELDGVSDYRIVVWNEGPAPDGAVIEIAPATFELMSPLSDAVIAPGSVSSAVFTWAAYEPADQYYFDIARTSGSPARTSLVELSPEPDDDALTCDAEMCQLSASLSNDLATFLATPGDYLWSVEAATADFDPIGTSNQVNRLKVEDGATSTATPDLTATPDMTGTPDLTATATPTTDPAVNLLVNGGFESKDGTNAPDLTPWTGKGLEQDKIKCNKPDKVFSYAGECAFVFKGTTKGTIQQTVTTQTINAGDVLTLSAYVKGSGLIAGAAGQVVLKYSDGTKTKAKLTFATDTLADYTLMSASTESLTAGTPSIKVKFSSSTGKLFLDEVMLTVGSAAGSRGRELPIRLP